MSSNSQSVYTTSAPRGDHA